MDELRTHKRIFTKKKKPVRSKISFELIAVFGLGVLCGLYMPESESLVSTYFTYFENLSYDVAFNFTQ